MPADIYKKIIIPEDFRFVSIREEEGEYLFEFLQRNNARSTLETGFGYGCSTSFIMLATQSPHIAIDPDQQTSFRGTGLQNVQMLGLRAHLRFIEAYSHTALPKLLEEGLQIDFAFIDGGHKFDEIFVDWFYCDQILQPNGNLIFHDASLESTQRVASFIRSNRSDYAELELPIKNFFAFRKIGQDKRNWDHYKPF
jgi:predicted O-methyltransferase YrrM